MELELKVEFHGVYFFPLFASRQGRRASLAGFRMKSLILIPPGHLDEAMQVQSRCQRHNAQPPVQNFSPSQHARTLPFSSNYHRTTSPPAS